MTDNNLENEIVEYYVKLIKGSVDSRTGDAFADYCKPVIMAEALTQKFQKTQPKEDFLMVMSEVMSNKDNKLQLTVVSTIYNEAMMLNVKSGQYTPMVTETSDDMLGHVAKYYAKVLQSLDDSSRDANNEKLEDRFRDLRELVQSLIGKNYKKGLFGKSKARWFMLEFWNDPRHNIGIISDVRDELGEDEARRLFMEFSDKILDDVDLLSKAISANRTK